MGECKSWHLYMYAVFRNTSKFGCAYIKGDVIFLVWIVCTVNITNIAIKICYFSYSAKTKRVS